MKATRRFLNRLFWGFIAICTCIAIAFETDLLPSGIAAYNKNAEFIAATIMELLTLFIVPVALKLLKFRTIEEKLTDALALKKWGTCRILMLGLPMLTNTLFYYLFMHVAFAYLAIIILLSMMFIVPTTERCASEIQDKH
ncbi:MAG: hypothetical protein ACI350_10365 [Prevotella sp.]